MKLRIWVEVLLLIITGIAFVIFASDTDNMMLFVISKVISVIVMCINALILDKYGRLIK